MGTVPAPDGVLGLPLVVTDEDGPHPVVITLHAAWEPHHYAADAVAALAGRLEAWVTHWRESLAPGDG